MNMHGIMTPIQDGPAGETASWADRARTWIWQRRVFMLVVALPIALLAAYLYLIAADQYESEAHFLVRTSNTAEASPGGGMSAALSLFAGASNSQSEAMSVADYLTSHDAVDSLRKNANLVERFHRTDVDYFSRLRKADPTPEQLLKYYRKQVKVHFNSETGITELKVHSFRPEDSFEIVRQLLQLGEQRVNILNRRSYHDAVAMAERQVTLAESDLTAIQGRLTNFRQAQRDIDPQASGQAQIALVATLTGQLAAARAQLQSMGNMINTSSPQYRAVAAKVRALEGQVAAQSGKLTGGNNAIANDISGYEELKVRQSFLAKRYEAAAAGLDKARDTAIRQQLYLVRVVDANMPVKALYPERGRILLTVAIALLLAYAIGWLIVAGVREHAA